MDLSVDARLQTYACDDEGRGDDLNMELPLLEGHTIDNLPLSPLSLQKNLNGHKSKSMIDHLMHEVVSESQEHGDEGSIISIK